VVAGEAPGGEFVDLGHSWDTPAPLLPVAREPWADARAPHLQNEARAQWQADKRAGLATAADEPTVLNTPWFDAALAEWDAWHARACAAVDTAVEAESLEPLPANWEIVDECDAYGCADERDADGRVPDWNDPIYRRDEVGDDEDAPVVEYKSWGMADFTRRRGGAENKEEARAEAQRREGVSLVAEPPFGSDLAYGDDVGTGEVACGPAQPLCASAPSRAHPSSSHRRVSAPPRAVYPFLNPGNCGNLAQLAPSFRASRQPSALARLLAGQRPGLAGETPHLRSSPLKARASASAKLHSERQVIESETDGSGPLRTKCGAMTGT